MEYEKIRFKKLNIYKYYKDVDENGDEVYIHSETNERFKTEPLYYLRI